MLMERQEREAGVVKPVKGPKEPGVGVVGEAKQSWAPSQRGKECGLDLLGEEEACCVRSREQGWRVRKSGMRAKRTEAEGGRGRMELKGSRREVRYSSVRSGVK